MNRMSVMAFMQVSLSVAEQGGLLNVRLRVALDGADELAWGLDHCSPHRLLRWAVPQRSYVQWRQLQQAGLPAPALELCTPVLALWGQLPFEADGSDAVLYSGQVPDGLIARALLERMAEACNLDELDRNLQMLQLEAGLSVVPGDSVVPSESLYEIASAPAAARPPEPVQPECAPADPVASDSVVRG